MVQINDTKDIWSATGLTVGQLKAFLENFNDDCPLYGISPNGGDGFEITSAKWNATTPGLGLTSEAILLI